MRDIDVRNAVMARLFHLYESDTDTRIIHELGLQSGAARIDIAVVNGSLSGYELKSDKDTLVRLPKQADVYGAVLDYVTLVVGQKHVEQALPMVPSWWGVTLATYSETSGAIKIKRIRPPKRNRKLEPAAVARLLWREEVLEELQERGLDGGVRSKRRSFLWAHLANSIEIDDLRDTVRDRLRTRPHWRSAVS